MYQCQHSMVLHLRFITPLFHIPSNHCVHSTTTAVSVVSSTCTGTVVRSIKYTTCCPNNAATGCSYTFPPVSGIFYAFPPVACAGLSPPVAFGVGFIGDDASADWDCCRCGGISLLLIEGLIANSVTNKIVSKSICYLSQIVVFSKNVSLRIVR